MLLGAVIGLPAFILTTTTPLLSSWFADVRSGQGDDPYWLYALSNGGSLLALLAYPLIIEPRLGLTDQRGVWLVGFALLVGLLTLAAVRAMPAIARRATDLAARAIEAATEAPARPIDAARRLRWILLAAIPSGLLSAVTTFIATDLVSAPLLWVWPLAIYLASFIIAFSPRGQRFIPLDHRRGARRSSRCCGSRSVRPAYGPSSRPCCSNCLPSASWQSPSTAGLRRTDRTPRT